MGIILCIFMGMLSACGSVAELTPPKYLPHNFPKGTAYPKINRPIYHPSHTEASDSDVNGTDVRKTPAPITPTTN